MAAVAEGATGNGFYWICDKSDEEQPTVLVTGMSMNMGLKFDSSNNTEGRIKRKSGSIDKSGKNAKAMQSAETFIGKASAQKLSSTVAKSKTITPAPEPALAPFTTAQAVINIAQAKSKPSLKDLCPEDKRRIANLIQELARVSEEKEESVQKLRDEQETFENKIQQLEQQNQLIVQERESLQQQYRECQELLGLYQQYLSQQQEKLKSITLLNHSSSHSKIPNSEGAPRRSWCGEGRGTALDGSYLDLPSSGSKDGSVECSHSFSTGPYSAPSSSIEQNCKVHNRQNHEYSEGGRTDPRYIRFFNGEPSTCDALRVRGASESRCSHQCHGMENGIVRGAIHTKLAPLLGSENWEEKRQCLLLQKKQLEVERERIQARLAQQEEKLLLQNQQLQQSYFHYSKLQQATTADFERPLNGTSSFNEGPLSSCVMDQVTHSEIREGETQTLQGSVRQPLSNVQSQEHATNIEQSAAKLSHEITITRKDMATSPVVPQSFRTSALPIGLLSTPQASRLDDSLIELLDIFSPASNPERYLINPLYRKSFVTPTPTRRTFLSPPGHSRPSKHDLEENQILEDIFFIC
ncbi:protein hinderin-like isoform X1 [Myxocyprinus asiaticus]|uniref:protein hinderin-like isoform X1 n=1 Tax=Myxocyprinus asiaticus TaxID=70543 RepID=UPI00222173AD|nr:protein hinderin-like isoform X1 [Myxocyprinus asiaticus]